jgi:hypothetical protein
MDITQFIHMYGKHKPRVLDTKYHKLRSGDIILAGDEAWTWLTPDCLELGWLKVPKVWHHTEYADNMAQVRRKDVTAFARTNPIDLQTCPVCGNRIPTTQINCGACGQMMSSHKTVKQPVNDDHLSAGRHQLEHIEHLRLKHKLLYAIMCFEGIGRLVDREDLTRKQAASVIRGALTIVKNRETTKDRHAQFVVQHSKEPEDI